MIRMTLTKLMLLCMAIFMPAQNQSDSLKDMLNPVDKKADHIEILLDKAKNYIRSNNDSAAYFATKAYTLSLEGNYAQKRAKAKKLIGLSHYYSFRYDQAMQNTNDAYKIWDELNDNRGRGDLLNVKGLIYWREGKYSEALSSYREGLDFYSIEEDSIGKMKILNNIGNLLIELDNRSDALKYFLEAAEICKEHAPKNLPTLYNNIGICYEGLNKCDSAMLYFNQSWQLYENNKDKKIGSSILNNMANVYVREGELEKALDLYQEAKKIARSTGNKQSLSKVLYNISEINSEIGNYAKAKRSALEAYELAENVNYKLIQKNASKILMNIESRYRNYKEAFEYSQVYIETRDSLFLSQKMLELGRLEAGYAFDKEQFILNEEIKRQDNIKTWLVIVLVLSALLLLFLYRIFRIKKKTNRILEKKNAHLAKQKRHIEYLNKNLENLVDERTAELQQRNSQLEKYAFINAHEVRAPLARILGLIHLRELVIEQQEKEKIFYCMRQSARELDDVVKNMTVALEE